MGNPKSANETPSHTWVPGGDQYFIGDAYEIAPAAICQEWEIESSPSSYLHYVKTLAKGWPHLRYLADFMEVSTTPLKWNELRGNQDKREERAERTNVALITWAGSEEPRLTKFATAVELEKYLYGNASHTKSTRLFVVEDLSREVIELLGAKFAIDPTFFRDHIIDYSWYNVRDRWADPPRLDETLGEQNWFQLRWMRARYFRNKPAYDAARAESWHFNVERRPDDDMNRWRYKYDKDGIVALTRTRASVWMNQSDQGGSDAVGIILVDPSVKSGSPLWLGYRNWNKPPNITQDYAPVDRPPRTSLSDDIVYWMLKQRPQCGCTHEHSQIILQPLLKLVCAEWPLLNEYVKTRLGQIDWELSFPEDFGTSKGYVDAALKRLHTWRRLVPLFSEMLSETLRDAPEARPQPLPNHPRNLDRPVSSCSCRASCSHCSTVGGSHGFHLPPHLVAECRRLHASIIELQDRIDRLASLVVATITIQDARSAAKQNESLARLSWLGTVFIPLGWVSALYSMQTDITQLKMTYVWYFVTAVPITCIALFLGIHRVEDHLHVGVHEDGGNPRSMKNRLWKNHFKW